MANPKYADLPGIAHDQPDVYETNDLPESDQGNLSMTDAIVDQSDSVETFNLSATNAYDKFKDKTICSKNVDFTDNIGHFRKTGYDIRSGDWEMAGTESREKETPLQTYNRVQFEVKQLYEKVNEMKEAKDASQVPPPVLLKQIEVVQKELQALNMESVLGTKALAELSDPLGDLHKKLFTQLEACKKAPAADKKKQPGTATPSSTDTDGIKYELYVKPDQAKLEQAAKVASLEQRLKNIENTIGQDGKRLSFLTSNTDGKSITDAISILSAKLNLLDNNYLDHVEQRFTVVHQLLQQVSEQRRLVEDVEKQGKVAALYDLVKKLEELSSGLPQVVERLTALKDLHEQALQFSTALTQLDTTQQQIVAALQTNEKMLKEAQGTFSKNNELIESNIGALNGRISNLK